jgi:hypothetical protein
MTVHVTDQRLVNGAQLFANDKTVTSPKGRVLEGNTTVSTVATATSVTLTPTQVLGGLILQDPSGGAVTTTLPTAALLAAALNGVVAGTALRFYIRNTADANEAITVAAGTGGGTSGTMTIAQNYSKEFWLVFTSKSAYTVYSLGSVAV